MVSTQRPRPSGSETPGLVHSVVAAFHQEEPSELDRNAGWGQCQPFCLLMGPLPARRSASDPFTRQQAVDSACRRGEALAPIFGSHANLDILQRGLSDEMSI